MVMVGKGIGQSDQRSIQLRVSRRRKLMRLRLEGVMVGEERVVFAAFALAVAISTSSLGRLDRIQRVVVAADLRGELWVVAMALRKGDLLSTSPSRWPL